MFLVVFRVFNVFSNCQGQSLLEPLGLFLLGGILSVRPKLSGPKR